MALLKIYLSFNRMEGSIGEEKERFRRVLKKCESILTQ